MPLKKSDAMRTYLRNVFTLAQSKKRCQIKHFFFGDLCQSEKLSKIKLPLASTHPQCLFLCWWYSSCLGDVKARSHTLHVTSSSSKVNHNGVKNILNIYAFYQHLQYFHNIRYICSIFIRLKVRKSQKQIILFPFLPKNKILS